MKIYLAARYSRRKELCEYRTELEKDGHEITGRWLNGHHQVPDEGLPAEANAELREAFAKEDWSDLMAAECCIAFTEPQHSVNSRGGRHVEFGAALASGHRCIVVGPRENVFHCLPFVSVFDSFEAARQAIKE